MNILCHKSLIDKVSKKINKKKAIRLDTYNYSLTLYFPYFIYALLYYYYYLYTQTHTIHIIRIQSQFL